MHQLRRSEFVIIHALYHSKYKGFDGTQGSTSQAIQIFTNNNNNIQNLGPKIVPLIIGQYLSSVAEILVGGSRPSPTLSRKMTNFSEILTKKRATNSLFECKWGHFGNLKVLSEI